MAEARITQPISRVGYKDAMEQWHISKRLYRKFRILAMVTVNDGYGHVDENVIMPTYIDHETGLMVGDVARFEKWITNTQEENDDSNTESRR